MTDHANLTKKEQQELRGAEARISRVAKLQQQLEEARQQASANTVKKIEDINAQVAKVDERVEKADHQVGLAQQRKQALVDRRDELVKAKHALADEIAEFLTPADHERLGLDTPENVTDNSVLTTEQVEAIAESAAKAEEEGEQTEDMEPEPYAEPVAEAPAKAKAETKAAAKPRRSRTQQAQ